MTGNFKILAKALPHNPTFVRPHKYDIIYIIW